MGIQIIDVNSREIANVAVVSLDIFRMFPIDVIIQFACAEEDHAAMRTLVLLHSWDRQSVIVVGMSSHIGFLDEFFLTIRTPHFFIVMRYNDAVMIL
jgi:hypothetical protein